MYSGTRALNQTETAYMQASVERIYDKFTSVVAEGRDMEVQDVDAIAQGRVWSGADAVEIGLVDEIGSLNDAILYAAAAAGHPDLSSWQIAEYPKPMTTFELLLESLAGGNGESVFSGTPLENVAEAFSAWDAAESGKVYARMPYEISIR